MLPVVIAGLTAIPAILRIVADGADLLGRLQAEEREPTPAETAQLRALSDAQHRLVQGA